MSYVTVPLTITPLAAFVGVTLGVGLGPGYEYVIPLNISALPLHIGVGVGVVVGVVVGVNVGVGVGVAPDAILQSNTAVKSNVSQASVNVGVGVGQNLLKYVSSKSGQTVLLPVGPNNLQSPFIQEDKHHLVSPVLYYM